MSSRLAGALRRVAGAAAVLAITAPAAGAQNFVLNFDLGQLNGTSIAASYGDVAGLLDVTIRGREGWGNSLLTPTNGDPRFWNDAYNDLDGIAYVGSSANIGEIVLDNLAAGQQITINSADVGSWPNVTSTVGLRVYDFSWNLLFSALGATAGSTVHASFAPGDVGLDGLYVQWARVDALGNPTEAFNTGIDNVDFTIGPITPGAVVPEPATIVLVAGGLALTAIGARRRRTA